MLEPFFGKFVFVDALHMSWRALAIRTDDFRLSFKLIEKLRSKNLSFEVIDVKKSVPSEKVVWFSTPSEIVNHPTLGTPIPVEIDSIDDAILSALFHLKAYINTRIAGNWC